MVTVATTYPTNAAKIFKWGNARVGRRVHRPVEVDVGGQPEEPGAQPERHAHPRGPGDRWRHLARLTGHARQYGRWEARVRGRNYGTSGTAYHAVWELTPTSDYHCGARNIVLSDYALGTNRAAMHVRKLPNRDFTASKPLGLTDNQFHTYAIEVTPTTSRGSSTPR